MLQLVSKKDPILRQKTSPFDFNGEVKASEFAEQLIQAMRDKQGIGLSAPQVGQSLSVFVIATEPEKVFFNPKLVYTSDEIIALDEVNSTFPGLTLNIKRPQDIRIRYQDVNGDIQTERFGGITSRIIQQMIAHLDGQLFYELASFYHKEKAKRKGLL